MRCYHAVVPDRSDLPSYLLSLPERVLRSATALAGGLIRQIGDVALPASVRRTRLYRSLVDSTLQFLIERVGQVEGAYPDRAQLAEDFIVRRAAGNGLELIGIIAFRASPVWVMAALADLSGAGRHLIREIADGMKQQGLLTPDTNFTTMEEILDGLEKTSGQVAEAINTPPLDVAGLRKEWAAIKACAAAIPPRNRPSPQVLEAQWHELEATAKAEKRSVFEVSALLALSAIRDLPDNVKWLSQCAQSAAATTGSMMASTLLDHYRVSLGEIRKEGFATYWIREFSPYLKAAAGQFSRSRRSLTEKLLGR